MCKQAKFCLTKNIRQKFYCSSFMKTVLTSNKPIYVGFFILELSKLLMYQFQYDYVLKIFDGKLLNYYQTLIV